ncbi:hypothetical protein HK098_003074 [Nowakowskiella sp. JEL0407]|nr:hypothetical protein HK098_003074 [Nowakowskiella sp. JEL0407]
MSDRMRTDSPISSRLGPSKIPRVSPSKIEKNNSYSSPPKRSISKLPPSLASRLNVPSSTPPKVSSNQIPKASSPSPVRKIVRNPDGTLQIQMPNQQASPKAVNNNAVASPSKIRSQFTKMYSEVPKNYGGMAKTGVAVSGPSKIHSSFIQNPVADSSLMQQSKVHRQVGLKISNLNWKTTADDIRIAFSEFGQLVSWVIQTPINNVMVAEVVFEKQEDAEKAYAEYNNQIVDGNVLKIEFIKSIIRQRDGMVGIGSIGGQESYPMEDLAMPSQPVVSRQFEPVKPVEKPIQKPKVVRGRGAKHNSKSGMYSDHIMSGRPLVSKASQNAQVVLVRKALDDMEGVETTFKVTI